MAARHRSAFGFLAVAVGLVAASFTLTAQGRAPVSNAGSARQDSVLARTPDGHPDFQGVWANNTVTPLQRPKQWEGKTLLTDAEIAELQNFAAQIVENDGDAQFGDGLITAVLNHVANPKSYDPGTGNYNQFWQDSAPDAGGPEAARRGDRPPQDARVRRSRGVSSGRKVRELRDPAGAGRL